jgi:hypothetical protein
MKYPVFVLSSIALAGMLYAGSLWLAFCGNGTAAAWCVWSQRWLSLIAWPVFFLGLWPTYLGCCDFFLIPVVHCPENPDPAISDEKEGTGAYAKVLRE